MSKNNVLKNYWEAKLAGEITPISIDTDFKFSVEVDRKDFEVVFDKNLSDRILKIGMKQDLSVFTILLSAFKVLILKYTQQNDITITTPLYTQIHTRINKELVKYVILRDHLDQGMTFKEILTCVKQTISDGYKHQEYPSVHILDEMKVSREAVLKVIMCMKNIHDNKTVQDIINSSSNSFTIEFSSGEGGLGGCINYNSRLFSEGTIQRIYNIYTNVLKVVLENIDTKLMDLELILKDDKNIIMNTFNNTSTDYPSEKTLHKLFENVVEKFEMRTAIESEGEILTYGDLNRKANQLAAVLREKGVSPNSIVGIMVERSLYMAIGILAILKSGGAYLPLDSDYPTDRINYMLDDSKAEVLLTHEHLKDKIEFSKEIVMIEDKEIYASTVSGLRNINKSSDLAYIIYTSGSTGTPKGVLIQHRNVVNYTTWKCKAFNLTCKDITLQLISYSFDGFGANFYPSILSGGKLVIPGSKKYRNYDYIRSLINNSGITHMGVVPSMYKSILEYAMPGDFKSLRIVALAGEKSDLELIIRSNIINSAIIIVNEYGPTENTIASTALIGIDASNTSIIGKPIDNNRVYILDKNLDLMPIGFRGELFVAGDGLAKGYLNNRIFTEEKFITDYNINENRIYRTGDIARWLDDGNIEFLGRVDKQIKIRGFRIEIGEIESVLLKYEKIREAVIIDFDDPQNCKYICAYLVSDDEIKPSVLRKYMLGNLPDYMVPSLFVQIDSLPLTPNGKIDEKALPKPDLSKILLDDYVPPYNDMEKKLQVIWQDVLRLERIGMNHDFFTLGGNSLKAMKVVSQLDEGLAVDVNDIYNNSTIRKLSILLQNKLD